MVEKRETRTVRLTRHALDSLTRVAFSAPFYCSSAADFVELILRGDKAALRAWQAAAKEDDK